jgi:hypothetical protein
MLSIPATFGTGADVEIVVTALGHGKPNLFVGRAPQPTAATATWSKVVTARTNRGTNRQFDTITIPHDEITNVRTLYMTVSCPASPSLFTHACAGSFSIVATLDRTQFLWNGYPQAGEVRKGITKFFKVRILERKYRTEDFLITAAPTDGRIRMFVGTEEPSPDDPSTYLWPSASTYESFRGSTVTISAGGSKWPDVGGNFWIGIEGLSSSAQDVSAFTVLARFNTTVSRLPDNVPLRMSLNGRFGEGTSGISTVEFKRRNSVSACELSFSITSIVGHPVMS